jgi:hypothetical protein
MQIGSYRINYQLSVISYQLSVISYQLSVISYQLSVISYQLSVISYQLSVISYHFDYIGEMQQNERTNQSIHQRMYLEHPKILEFASRRSNMDFPFAAQEYQISDCRTGSH